MIHHTQGPRRLPTSALLAYGTGEMNVTVGMVLFGLFLLFFYTSVMGLSPAVAGLATGAGLVWDAVIDPYIGHRSDRQGGRLGRRHGYMLVGSVLSGASFALLLSPPRGTSTAALVSWLLGTTLLFRFASAVFRIPYLSLGAELSADYDERTTIVGVRSAFGMCGTLGAASLSFLLFFPQREVGLDPRLTYSGYPRMGLAFGLLMAVAGLLSAAGTFSRRHHREGPPAPEVGGFLEGFASAWCNPSFRSVWLAFTLFFFGVVLNAALALYYFTWYVRIGDSAVLARIQLCFYAGALVAVYPWVRLARRHEKRVLCVTALVATAVLMALATLLFGEGRLFGTGRALPLLAGNLVGGAFAAALWVLPGSMLADVADDDELRTGERREGLLFGLLNVGEKMAAGAALLTAGVLLDLFVGFAPGASQTGEVVARIGLLYGLAPAAPLLAGAACVAHYRLHRAAVRAIQDRLRRPEQLGSAPRERPRMAAASVLG